MAAHANEIVDLQDQKFRVASLNQKDRTQAELRDMALPLRWRTHRYSTLRFHQSQLPWRCLAKVVFLIKQAGLKRPQVKSGAVTLKQRFGPAATKSPYEDGTTHIVTVPADMLK